MINLTHQFFKTQYLDALKSQLGFSNYPNTHLQEVFYDLLEEIFRGLACILTIMPVLRICQIILISFGILEKAKS